MANDKPTRTGLSIVQAGTLVALAGVACFLFGIMAGYTFRGIRESSLPESGVSAATGTEPGGTEIAASTASPAWPAEPVSTWPPTWTPRPTNTPRPTRTPWPTNTPTPPVPPLGRILLDQWELLVTRVESLPAQSSDQQIVAIFVTLTNHGSQDGFIPLWTLELMDASGRRYAYDVVATGNVRRRYGIDTWADASMPPESSAEVAYAFIAPGSERTFTIVPGDLVSSWSGDLTFILP